MAIFVFVLLAMTAHLPAGLQNAVADAGSKIYLGVPKAPIEVFVAAPPPPTTTTTTAAPVPTAPPEVTIPTPITVPPTTETTTTIVMPTPTAPPTTARPTTTVPITDPPDTVDVPVTDPPPPPTVPLPSIPIPTTGPECTNPMIVSADAKIQQNNRIVYVTVTVTGQIKRMQAAIAGQGFTLLTKVQNQNTFIGSLQSLTPIAVGTSITIIGCSASVNTTVAAHAY